MTGRHVTTGITLLLLAGLLAAGFYYGVNQLFAPLERQEPVAEPTPSCSTVEKGQTLRSEQVAVNVFNGGIRAGLAGRTLDALTNRGFLPGEVGNAPTKKVRRAQVWIVEGEEAAGRLVALNFGPKTPVKLRKKDLAEGGVDVIVGNNFEALKKPKRKVRVRVPQVVCSPASPAATAAAG